MTVSKTAAGSERTPRTARKERAESAAEGSELQMGELSELLG